MLKPLPPATPHLTEETLEEYRFHRLPESQVEALEEHLLICPQCCEVLRKVDEFASAVRMYASLPAPAAAGAWARGVGMGAIIAAAAVGLTIATIHPAPPVPRSVKVLQLVTFRGGDGDATIPADSDSIISLDLADLPSDADYQVRIVNARGQQVWAGQDRASGGELKIHLFSGFRPGAYWLRLYAKGELLREFELRAK